VGVKPAGEVVQPRQQPRDRPKRSVGLAPVRIRRHGDLPIDEHEPLPAVLVDADSYRGTHKAGVSHRPQEGMNRTRLRIRRTKNMRTDTDNLARVSDPSIELRLRHTAALPTAHVGGLS
jgi:hypothetical protein